jgi:hypothetical protein
MVLNVNGGKACRTVALRATRVPNTSEGRRFLAGAVKRPPGRVASTCRRRWRWLLRGQTGRCSAEPSSGLRPPSPGGRRFTNKPLPRGGCAVFKLFVSKRFGRWRKGSHRDHEDHQVLWCGSVSPCLRANRFSPGQVAHKSRATSHNLLFRFNLKTARPRREKGCAGVPLPRALPREGPTSLRIG